MALAIDKYGKVFEKHLTMSEKSIRKVISKGSTKKQKQVLQRALKVKFNHEIASQFLMSFKLKTPKVNCTDDVVKVINQFELSNNKDSSCYEVNKS